MFGGIAGLRDGGMAGLRDGAQNREPIYIESWSFISGSIIELGYK